MTDNKPPKLIVNEAEASERISKQIDTGKELLERQLSSEQELDKLKRDTRKWTDYNKTLFDHLFDESPLPDWHGKSSLYIMDRSLSEEISDYREKISQWINELESIYGQLDIYTELPSNTQQTMNNENKKIFIGHGGSNLSGMVVQIYGENLRIL